MRKLKTAVGRRLQLEREAEREARRRTLPASRRTAGECYPHASADAQANRMRRVVDPYVRDEDAS